MEHLLEEDGDDTSEEHEPDVLPWWRHPVTVTSMIVGLLVLSGAAGYVIGNNRAIADPNSTDVGFLQDMRYHHEQAVQLSFIYLDAPDGDPRLRTVARAILVGQNIEIGRMLQMLRDFGESEVNETDVAMTWMGHPTPLESMHGLATEQQITAFAASTGRSADEMFVTLMSAHHSGGADMAEFAATNAATREVRRMAEQMANSQRKEITEMQNLLARSRS